MIDWSPTRNAGLKRLNIFLPNAGTQYRNLRNYDYGPEDRSNISCLSPWIKYGLVTETEIIQSALGQHSLKSANKFIEEVFWRSYFKGWLEHYPKVWDDYCQSVVHLNIELENSSRDRQNYCDAISGRTGIDCFDAWIEELISTGYLHNHARMWFASIWIFTLRLPWQLGADFFYQHLMDADAASNTCSWRWVAGLHTKGKHYIARADNIAKFTDGRYSPDGLAFDPEPLIETQFYEPRTVEIPNIQRVDSSFAILITDEDCSTSLVNQYDKHSAVLVLADKSQNSEPQSWNKKRAFKQGAMNEALEIAKKRSHCDVKFITSDDWVTSLHKFAEGAAVKTIVTTQCPVGETRDRLLVAKMELMKSGIELLEIPRAYDTACLPYTKAGYFKLKSKIPFILNELGWWNE